jgi:ATPase subunit of ABC transporter with duplicated ATPase domains
VSVEKLNVSAEGTPLLCDFSLTVNKNDKIAFVGLEHIAKSALFDVIAGVRKQDSGAFTWGQTTSFSYFPKDNAAFFTGAESIVDWLKQYSSDQDETYVRGFLGRMLFSGDEALKPVNVLSGGEKVRCMLSMMMLSGANVLVFDEPTNHLDLEAITALNDGLKAFPGVILFNSHDHEFVASVATRIIEILPGAVIDRQMSFDDYLVDGQVNKLRTAAVGGGKLGI